MPDHRRCPGHGHHHRRADDLGDPAFEGRPPAGPVGGAGTRVGYRVGYRVGRSVEDRQGGLFDSGPTGAPAQVGQQGPVDPPGRVRTRAEGGQPHDDAGGAEAALAAPGGHQRGGPPFGQIGGETVESGDLAALEPADRGDAGDPGRAVHPDRAAAALPLGAAPVLDRAETELVAQDVEERRSVVGHLDVGAVDAEPDQRFGFS